MKKYYLNFPDSIKCFYKRNWFNQILFGLRDYSKLLIPVSDINEADLIFCIIDDVPSLYDRFKQDFDILKKYIIIITYQDHININDHVVNNKYILAFFSCFKFIGSNPKNIPILNISSSFKRSFNKSIKSLKNRKFDIVFLGKINYDDASITDHRTTIVNKLINIADKHKLNYLIRDKIDRFTYIDILNDTKIFISPWGYGQWSLKEIECICNGAHVIIPNNNIITYPNFYEYFDGFDNNVDLLENIILKSLYDLDALQLKVNKNRNLFQEHNLKNQIIVIDNFLENLI